MTAPHPDQPARALESSRVSRGLFAALLTATAFGVSAPFARPAAAAGISGADLILWRVGVMAVILGLVAAAMRRPLLPPPGSWPGLVLFAASTAGVGVCYLSAIAFVPVGIAVLIFYTFPLVILLASPFVDGRRPTPAQLAAFALAFAGLALAIGPQWTSLDPRGLVLAAFASLAATVQVFAGARVAPRLDPLTFGFASLALVLPLAFGAAWLSGGPAGPTALIAGHVPLLAVVLAFTFGYAMQIRALRLAPANLLGLVFTIEPVAAIGIAALLLGERLVAHQYMGIALVLAGLVIAMLPATPSPRTEPAS